MEKFLELVKNNPKKAIVVAITLLVFAVGNFITGCTYRYHADRIDNITKDIKIRGN